MSPSLVFTPREAEGLGLADIAVAIQAQRVKEAVVWLLGRKDINTEAWLTWIDRHHVEPLLSPRSNQRSRPSVTKKNHRLHLQEVVGKLLGPTTEQAHARRLVVKTALGQIAADAGKHAYQPALNELMRVQ
ncbi:hypothetical protein F442_03267, partial [Phytophthora nicotianae P10297]